MLAETVVLALPTTDRVRAHAYWGAAGLGLDTPGDPADDGVPEPLRVVLNPGLTLVLVPTDGFRWVVAGRDVAEADVVECQLSVAVDSPAEVDALVERARAAGAEVAAEPEQQPWGYAATVADPDGHLMTVLVPAP
ncbi:VOC family protein [Nocardioides sp.]|uniref:VOC family protein n=1 Tax=Nocardioides sp. TaxID=35761 RepID=UPI002726DAA4|nr:VOC family protein [Nocardioides sp.]MDO9456087.1 VOC family protein [Nocardioides sp.]